MAIWVATRPTGVSTPSFTVCDVANGPRKRAMAGCLALDTEGTARVGRALTVAAYAATNGLACALPSVSDACNDTRGLAAATCEVATTAASGAPTSGALASSSCVTQQSAARLATVVTVAYGTSAAAAIVTARRCTGAASSLAARTRQQARAVSAARTTASGTYGSGPIPVGPSAGLGCSPCRVAARTSSLVATTCPLVPSSTEGAVRVVGHVSGPSALTGTVVSTPVMASRTHGVGGAVPPL